MTHGLNPTEQRPGSLITVEAMEPTGSQAADGTLVGCCGLEGSDSAGGLIHAAVGRARINGSIVPVNRSGLACGDSWAGLKVP